LQFRGAWDELIEDECLGREPRFQLERRNVFNFEVGYDVTTVTVLSPTLIDVHIRLMSEFGGPEENTWTFRLVKNGAALAARDGDPPYFLRCRYRLDRHTGSYEPDTQS
jgi:hypothetical protein